MNTKVRAVNFAGLAILCTAFVLGIYSPAFGLFSDKLKGNIQITGVSSKTDEQTSKTLNQQYTMHWYKDITEYLQTRASLRYNNLGIDQSQSGNSWRYEFQPAGEIAWNHPDLSIGGSLRRLQSTSNNEATDLIRNNAAIYLITRKVEYPILNIRYDRDHTYNKNRPEDRDTREDRIQGGLNYDYHNQYFYYNATFRRNENINTGLKVNEMQQLFRWNQTSWLADNRLRLSSGYNFNYRRQTTKNFGNEPVREAILPSRGLYLYDPSPEFGEMDSLRTLIDGNTSDGVQPQIDIGEGYPDQNIGVDFGLDRTVSAIYVYTDRPSGSQLGWRIYTSDDNLTWDPYIVNMISEFNPSYNRYEITFEPVTTRYIKAVSNAFNEVSSALITEVQPLIERTGLEEETRDQSGHLADLSGTYRFSDEFESSADISAKYEPTGDFNDSRNQLYYSLSSKHTPNSYIAQIVSYQSGFEDYKERGTRNDNSTLSYTLLLTPLSTLSFSVAAASRTNYIDHVKIRETNNLYFQADGTVLPGFNLSLESGYNRNNQFDSRQIFDTWTFRVSADANLRRSLDAIMYYLYQSTNDLKTESLRIRRQYSLNLNYRLTRTMLFRGSVTIDDEDGHKYVYQEYNFSWNVTRKITAGGLVTFNDDDNELRSNRYNARLNYSIGSRSSLFFSYNRSEYSLADRADTRAFQIGLKTGF